MFLLIDKPKGMTSHDVVDSVRRLVSRKPPAPGLRRVKVGHAGTLDPNATGLLILGVGRESTKKLGNITADRKSYEAKIFLGEVRTTDDVEGQVIEKKPPQGVRSSHLAKAMRDDSESIESLLTESNIKDVLMGFVGEQEQVPPQYSAIKKGGKKAYNVARAGGSMKLDARKVTIFSIHLVSYEFPILKIITEVSSGTYIRSLARDIGRELGCGAYLKNLRRTSIGGHNISDAVTLDQLTPDNWQEFAVQL